MPPGARPVDVAAASVATCISGRWGQVGVVPTARHRGRGLQVFGDPRPRARAARAPAKVLVESLERQARLPDQRRSVI